MSIYNKKIDDPLKEQSKLIDASIKSLDKQLYSQIDRCLLLFIIVLLSPLMILIDIILSQ